MPLHGRYFLPETLEGGGGTGGRGASGRRDVLRGTSAVGGGGTGGRGAFEGCDDFLPETLEGGGGIGGRGASGVGSALSGTSAVGGGGGTRPGAFAADRSASLNSRRSSAEFSRPRRKRTTSGHARRPCASWILWIIRNSLGSGRKILGLGLLPDAISQFYGQSQDCQPVHAHDECIGVASRRSSRLITGGRCPEVDPIRSALAGVVDRRPATALPGP